ncbi:MAG: TIGR01906 family membrane protein [Lachnospiraceae bacterium]|nr:TIGR01906 family membrane protein [Lachnospiraceae bacterium]
MDNKTSAPVRWLITAAAIISFALFIISASIAVPIVIRPFYYAQVKILKIEETTGYTYDEITEAYDEMMDYCLGLDDEFGTGTLVWSESGRDHFADCRSLFILDLTVLGVTSAFLIIYAVLKKFAGIRPCWLKGRSPCFWAGLGVLVSFAVIAGLGSIDFDRTFVIFHKIFFPGKTNWVFYPEYDEIIKILPETFFMNCAILIVTVLAILCVIAMIAGRKSRKGD